MQAKSWGKIKIDANPVKVYAEATLVFPLLVAMTFASDFVPEEEDTKETEASPALPKAEIAEAK